MTPGSKKLILASRSPRRSELLRSLCPEFEVSPSQVAEVTDPAQSPEQNALNIARDKARWVARKNPGCFVLGADTIVVLNQEIIGQPAGPEDAFRILSKLEGKQHRVITGIVIVAPKGNEYEAVVISKVTLRSVGPEALRAYIGTGEPLDKAGAYAIQGKGSDLVESWEGSYSNIVGLPLEALRGLLQQSGYPIPEENENQTD